MDEFSRYKQVSGKYYIITLCTYVYTEVTAYIHIPSKGKYIGRA